jgi:hypothetical protein
MANATFGMVLDQSGYHIICVTGCAHLNRYRKDDVATYATVSEAIADAAHTMGGYGAEIRDEADALARIAKIHPCAQSAYSAKVGA